LRVTAGSLGHPRGNKNPTLLSSLALGTSGVRPAGSLASAPQQGDLQAPIDFSFLSDTIILLRYFEAAGEVRKAISVVKKRSGLHEPSIREYRLSSEGVQVGPMLLEFQGILAGTPTYTGASGLSGRPAYAD
jgi:circadian clock protein KaiC